MKMTLTPYGKLYQRVLRNSLWKEHFDEFPNFFPYVCTEDRKERAIELRKLKKELKEFLTKYPKNPKEN